MKWLLAIFSLLLLSIPSAAYAANQPRWVVQHDPTAANLTDISCSSASECFAVGANATIIKTVNGGAVWTKVSSAYGLAYPSALFTSVRCPASGVCSVLAVPNVVLHTTDGGRTWQKHMIALSPLLSGLGRLACPLRNVCFVTASPSGDPGAWFTHSAAIFKTSDGNRSWHRLSIPSSVPCPGDCGKPTVGFDLQWISCQNGLSCRAGGVAFIGSHEGFSSAVIRTNNGGSTWIVVHHDFDANSATCPTTSICTGIFYQPFAPYTGPDLVRTVDGGATWTRRRNIPVLTSISCTGTTFCELAGPHGKLAMTNGLSLSMQTSPTSHDLTGVACPRVSACYAVGEAGTILSRK